MQPSPVKTILWVSDLGCRSGFGNVAKNLTKPLTNYNLIGLGINYQHKRQNPEWDHFDHIIASNALSKGDLYGFEALPQAIQEYKPDLLVLFNDYFVIHEYLNRIEDKTIPIIIYYPVDSETMPTTYKQSMNLPSKYFPNTYVFSYSKFANSVSGNNNEVLYHGVSEVFKPSTKPPEQTSTFTVLAVSQLQVRKGWHALIRGFLDFNTLYPNSQLVIHTSLVSPSMGAPTQLSSHLLQMLDSCGVTQEMMDNNQIILTSKHQEFSEEELNQLYTLADVFITDNLGEGFGLTTVEALASGTRVIVPNNTVHEEIFQEHAHYMTCDQEYIFNNDNMNLRRGASKKKVAKALESEYKLWIKNKQTKVLNIEGSNYIKTKFNWETPQKQLKDRIDLCLEN